MHAKHQPLHTRHTHTHTHTHSHEHTGTPFWIDEILTRAFSGIVPFDTDEERVQMIVKTLESSLQFAYVMHLFDAAIAKAK